MRYTKSVRAEIDRAIHDANIANLSHAKTIQYVQDRLGILIGHTQLVERRRILRNRSIDLWNEYRTDNYSYRLEHLERMNEARKVKDSAAKKMMEYEDDPKKLFQWRTAVYVFLDASKYLSELHAMIPEIDSIGHSDSSYEMEQEIPSISRTEEGSTQAVF